MDVQTLTTMISSVGFPIAACCIMFVQNNKMQETLSELTRTLSTMNERIKDVEDAVKEK